MSQIEEKRLLLCLEFDGEHSHQLAFDYWNGHYDGKRWLWVETVEQVANRYGIKKKDVISAVRSAAAAFDLTLRCDRCNTPRELSSRSEFGKQYGWEYICDACTLSEHEARLQEQRKQELVKRLELEAIVARESSNESLFDYRLIDYRDAILIYSIMLASDEACEKGVFDDPANLNLSPSHRLTGEFLGSLFDKKILQFAADTSPTAVEFLDGGAFRYYPLKVKWRFARDVAGRSFPRVMTDLGRLIDSRDEHPEYNQAVSELWWILGFEDALQFLFKETESYRIADYRKGPKTDQAIRHALERFSIPETRREIRNVVKNAAALSVSRNFNQRHALNTIPGNLISYVDRAVSENWQLSPVLFDWKNEEPVLLTVLFNRVLGTGLTGFKTLSGAALQPFDLQVL